MRTRLLAALGLIILIGLVGYHQYAKKKAVKAAIAVLQQSYEKELARQSEIARKTEWKLQESLDKAKEQKDEDIKKLSNKLNTALSELRKRPSRSQGDTKDTGDTKACTGRELFREDAEFLAREANRADRVRLERDYYYEQYESIRRGLGQTPDKE